MILAALAGLVSLTFDSMPLPLALARISKATGERLECAEDFRNEPLVARLKDVVPERVLKEIADCFDARWEPRGERRVLVPDARLADDLARIAGRKAALALAKSLDEEMKMLVEHPAFGRAEADALRKRATDAAKRKPNDEETSEEEEVTPAARAIRRIVKAIGTEGLLRMVQRERDVYAERPTPMQLAFPNGAIGAIATYRREHGLLDPEHSVDRVRLSVARDGDSFQMLLIAVGTEGHPVDGGMLGLDAATEGEAPPPKKPGEKPLSLPQEAAEYLALHARGAKRDALLASWRGRLADPVGHEPTAWFPGASLRTFAESRGLNLLVSPPDLSPRLGLLAATAPTGLLRWFEGDLTERDGWLRLKPRNAASHVSRADAAALLAKVAAQGGLGIDDAADWCARYPGRQPTLGWLGPALTMLTPASLQGFNGDELAFWETLTPQLRAALRGGRPLPLAALPAEAQRVVGERIYWGDEMNGLENDPTDVLPDGLGCGVVAMRSEEAPVVLAWPEGDEPISSSPFNAERFGTRAAAQERTGNVVAYGRFRLGFRTTYTIETSFPGVGAKDTITMVETFFDPRAKPVDRLPDDFAKAAEAAKQKALLQADDD